MDAAAILGTIAGIGIVMEWNPLGWIALLVAGTGFSILAVFFEDDLVEELCKCCQFHQAKVLFFGNSKKLDFDGTLVASINYHYVYTCYLVNGITAFLDYRVLYERTTDILFGGTVIIESNPNRVSANTLGVTTIEEHFKKELCVTIHFGMAKMFTAKKDLQIYLCPYGFVPGKEQILLTSDPVNGNVRIIEQDDVAAEFFVTLFDIPEKHQHIPKKFQYREQAEIVVLCRCIDNAHTFPIDKDKTPRYLAVREKLFKSQQVSNYPVNPFTSELRAKEEEERKRKLLRVALTLSSKNAKIHHRNYLLNPINWD